jgi:hypothetical protein
MRYLIVVLTGGMLLMGCASHKKARLQEPADQRSAMGEAEAGPSKKSKSKSQAGSAARPAVSGQSLSVTNQGTVLTLSSTLTGKVAKVNVPLRFVVLDFGLDRLPALDQRLSVYRQGLKVGELKVTGPVMLNNIVADVVAGEANEGDEVRGE